MQTARGAGTAKRILEAAAVPIHQQMKANATRDPRRRSGDLHAALNIGKVKRSKKRGTRITIGVHRQGLEPRGLLSRLRGIWSRRTSARARASLHPSRV